MKKISILGSTGSIGTSALSVVASNRDLFRVVGLTGNRNISLLIAQIGEFQPEVVAVPDRETADEIRKHTRVKVLHGMEGLNAVASWDTADFVLSSIVGSAGLLPTLSAIRAGKTIGLANKETLVVAGDIIMQEARKHGVALLPVDSEHSAVFQCMEGRSQSSLRKVILTASGGPFNGRSFDDLRGVLPADALKHPSWSMGRKITIDSATLMNKGLEVIEAHHLFGIGPDMIDVVIHPQSIVHSLVEFKDGSCIAQLSVPDMRGAIAYALSYPERISDVVPPLDLARLESLTFSRPDHESFPCLGYAYDALREGGSMPAVLNAANEVAVEGFLEGEIGFTDIPAIIKRVMDGHTSTRVTEIEEVLHAHHWAIDKAMELIERGIGG